MFARFFRWLFTRTPPKVEAPAPVELDRPGSFFTSDAAPRASRAEVVEAAYSRSLTVTPERMKVYQGETLAADSASGNLMQSAKAAFAMVDANIPDAQLLWYSSQSFIGFQLCAILAQHWLIHKACDVPARDAIRNGYKVTINNGKELPGAVDRIRRADRRFKVREHCRELVRMSRVFGIRIALFKVDSPDPKYYERPFNPDGITPGSYRGIVQVDPYWCVPELSVAGASSPTSSEFYEPTYWTIQGVRYHRSHLVIVRGPEVADILKPSYQYAGLSVPQRIYERVYSAERTANEAPQLALTKRAMVFYTDTGKALADQGQFQERLSVWAQYRDNFGVKVADKEGDKIEQHDTALGDFDALVMTQYQLVAAIANVPATKLLGTTPKGFNATGEYEEASYHEELESIQTNDMEPLVARHHLLLVRSEIAPAMNVAPFAVTVEWEATDAPTAKEEAEVQKLKAETDNIYTQAGALDGHDIRRRLAADPKSGYDGIDADDVPPPRPAAPAGHPFGAHDGAEFHTLDASEWDASAGTYCDAELISNQTYRDPEIVAAKIAAGDFTVELSPEFQTATGKSYRVIIDGHHSLTAAIESGNTPVFVERFPADSDYVNVVTRLPMSGQSDNTTEFAG